MIVNKNKSLKNIILNHNLGNMLLLNYYFFITFYKALRKLLK